MKTKKRALAAGLLCLALFAAFPIIRMLQERSLNVQTREILADMTRDEKIGQVLLMNFRSWGTDAQDKPLPLEECNDTIRGIIQDYHLGSVILFGENVQSTEKAVRLVDDLQKAALSGGLPLLIGIDQEGGIVTRLGQGTCHMALGASEKPDNARLAGEVIGEELAAIGINCDFAPVCDVNDNPRNPVIHLLSFSSDPAMVSTMAKSFRKGLTESGIISAVKHFPGHGNTSADTHVGLAVVDKTREEWNAVEAVPFRAMIRDDADMIMSAHIQYPKLDDTKYGSKLTGEELYLPATLSHKILTDILRGELGFDGVVVTDAMNMKAIADNFGEAEASVMALAAGADLLCNPTTVTSEEEIVNLDRLYAEIEAALEDGRLSTERLNEAAGRVIRLKLKYGIVNHEQNGRSLEEKVENALAVVGSPEHRKTERALAEAAVTLYSDAAYEPFKPAKGDTILFLVPYENKGNSAAYAMNRLTLEGKLSEVTTQSAIYEKQTEVNPALQAQIKEADYIILVSQMTAGDLNAPENWQVKTPGLLLQTAEAAGKLKCCAVISAGLPNDAVNFPGVPVYLAYGYQGMAEKDAKTGQLTQKYGPNLPAAIDCLMGAFKPRGKLPVKLE